MQQTNGKLELLGDVYDAAPYGIVVPKAETEFATAVQGAVQKLIDGGQYEAILTKWNVQGGRDHHVRAQPDPLIHLRSTVRGSRLP